MCIEYFGDLAQHLSGLRGHCIPSAIEEHLVRDIYIYYSFLDLDIDVLIIQIADCALEISDQYEIERVLAGYSRLEAVDV